MVHDSDAYFICNIGFINNCIEYTIYNWTYFLWILPCFSFAFVKNKYPGSNNEYCTRDITLLYLYMYSDTNNHFVTILHQLYLGIFNASITGNGWKWR
jgi:hypothetical protein